MDLSDIERALRSHARWIAILSFVAAAGAWAFSYLVTEKYEATGLLLLKPEREPRVATSTTAKELLDFPVSPEKSAASVGNTLTEIIESRTVAERVVLQVGLDRETESTLKRLIKDAVQSVWQVLKYGRVVARKSPREKAIEDYIDDISVSLAKDAYTFEIEYEAKSPATAAAVVNTAAEVSIELVGELDRSSTSQSLQAIGRRLEASRRELDEAGAEYRRFKEDNAIVSLDEEMAEDIKVVGQLESALEKARASGAGLLAKWRPDHPEVLATQAEAESLRAAIEERRAAMKRRAEQEARLRLLDLRRTNAEDIHKIIVREYEQAQLRDERRFGEVRVVSRAVEPLLPTRPIRVVYALAALLVGAVVGAGLAVVGESRQGRGAQARLGSAAAGGVSRPGSSRPGSSRPEDTTSPVEPERHAGQRPSR